MDLDFDAGGEWSFRHDGYMLWATSDGGERIRFLLSRAMFADRFGINDQQSATRFAEQYRDEFLSRLQRLADAGAFSGDDNEYHGRQLIMTTANFGQAMGSEDPFVSEKSPQ